MTAAEPSLAREFEAALAWWRAAGVDCDFTDDATAWLSDAPQEPMSGPQSARSAGENRKANNPAEGHSQHSAAATLRAAPPAPEPAVNRRNLLGDSPPTDLAAFRDWWMSAPELGAAGLYPRIAPRGGAGAKLMVLVPQPEANDRDALLSGAQGRLLANMLAAMGIAAEDAYIASALPAHTPMADLPALAAGGMDAVTALHVRLAQPQRLLLLGIPLEPMLAPLAPPDETPLRGINYNGANTPVMVSEALDAMLDMPPLKTRFWKRWIEWSAA